MTAFESITLERGTSHDAEFEKRANMVFDLKGDGGASLKNYRKDIWIELLNCQGSCTRSV